ncbi:MAG: UDP-N-acetylmuramoyl-L-alanine--D-glutamate ligase [Pirellulales bacterium]
MSDFSGLRVTVLGLGRHGGGIGAARFLARRGARVTISDQLSADELAGSLAALADVPIERFSLGGHRECDVREADLVVVNPAVRPSSPVLSAAAAQGIQLTSEIELFLRHCPARVIGVTGTNGKSTTATLSAAMLRAAGQRCWLGGNLGGSLLDSVDAIGADDWVVLEVSSFQLARLANDCPGPANAIVTNCTPNHLDWHGKWSEYVAAKQRLLQMQPATGMAFVGPVDELDRWRACVRGSFYTAKELPDAPQTGSWPHHLRLNAKLAAAAAAAAGVGQSAIEQALTQFQPLDHRQQAIADVAGRTFVDDSKATTPEATIAALASLKRSEPRRRVWLLAGGSDKQCDFAPLGSAIARGLGGVACYGAVGRRLSVQLAAAAPDTTLVVCKTLDEALAWCWRNSAAGDTVLLSPACASHDQYADYVARAGHFRQLVDGLAKSHNAAVSPAAVS